MRIIFGLVVLAFTCSCVTSAEPVTSKGGMVVCVSPAAADVGAAILKQGGNAVDATVAVGLAQAVTWPEAGNIGGGGFMLVWPGDGKKPVVIDYRETAPASAKEDMFAKDLNVHKAYTAGVPGTIRGFEKAHQQFGKLPWKDLVAPAIKLAEDGVTVTPALARSLNTVLKSKLTRNTEFLRVFEKKGEWKEGDILKQPDLAKTLQAIAEKGADGFYTGAVADLIVKEMKDSNGLISHDDLKKYVAKERTPITSSYRGYGILALPPPSGGGTTLITTLNILENYEIKKHAWSSPQTTHLVTEAIRRAYCDRVKYIGDPEFAKVPTHLTTKEHAKKLAESIDLEKATKSETLAPELKIAGESEETTHYSVIDKSGMAVSNTYTLENSYGCRVVVKGAGFILNNEMTDFNHRPGVTDKTGRVGTPPNLVSPGKRMLSSQCPVILLKDGKPVLITGSPGGRTIPNTVLTVIVNFVDYGADVQTAVNAPRIHHQWLPDQIGLEDREGFKELNDALNKLGHIVVKRRQGDAHSIAIDPKTGLRTAGVDKRIEGKAGTD